MNRGPAAEQITIATLNIASASKERARRILDDWIAPPSREVDAYVFTETSDGSGTQLITSEFRRGGWTIFQRPTIAGDRGVVVATRLHATESNSYPSDSTPGRCIVINLQTIPRIQLVGMYVPNRGNDTTKTERKRAFLVEWLRFLADTPISSDRILVGDLNVVPPTQHPQFLPQQQFEYDWFEKLKSRAGLCDAAVDIGDSGHESTWVAHTGEGYTYDHILLQKSLLPRVVKFKYDHSTRSRGGVTDHSALSLSLKVDTARIIHRRSVTVPTQAELF